MTKADIYTRVTNQIIAALEKGQHRFQMPWHSDGVAIVAPRNAQSKRPYRGINTVVLWAAADARGYDTGLWATYQQWQQLGAHVRKGEKSTEVVFWRIPEARAEKEGDDAKAKQSFLVRGFSVFNAAQVDGFTLPEPSALEESERVRSAEEFFQRTGARVEHGGDRAYYDSLNDFIRMPQFSRFKSAGFYYSTLAHEVVHWTGAADRLNRDLANRFGSEAYAAEELIAELGAAMLAAVLGTFSEPRGNHAAYVAS